MIDYLDLQANKKASREDKKVENEVFFCAGKLGRAIEAKSNEESVAFMFYVVFEDILLLILYFYGIMQEAKKS